MKKLILILSAILITGVIAGATVWMLRHRNEPPPPPPDPRPCVTAARTAGMSQANLEAMVRVINRTHATLDWIQVREQLRLLDLPECDWLWTDRDREAP